MVRVILADDRKGVERLLRQQPSLAFQAFATGATRARSQDFYLEVIDHYLYRGDTPLHVAAAGYRLPIARRLLASGADVRARNRRGAQALHYAADGIPDSPAWNPRAQAAMIACLLSAGADPDTPDSNGATALHRAVRTRCAAAVAALLAGGADVHRCNHAGSSPWRLARVDSGRGGSGSPRARAQQVRIEQLLRVAGAADDA